MNDIMLDPQLLSGSSASNAENFMKQFLSSPTMKKLLEVMVIQTFDRVLKPILEDSFRKIVKHELEQVEKRLFMSKRSGEKDIQAHKPRSLKLKFLTEVSGPVLTGVEIKGKGGTAIKVALVDDISGEIIDSGPEASARVEVVVLRGDFGDEAGDNWTSEEFSSNVVRDRDANKSLLAETVQIKLNKGIGFVDKIKFSHSSSYMKKSVFCLGGRVINSFNGTQVKEAKTEPFDVKDGRQLYHEKHDPPSLTDGVQRLKNIGRGGKKRLGDENVHSVEDFLILLLKDPERLKSVLNLKPTMCSETMSHAQRCIVNDKMYCYTDSQQNAGVVFNIVGKVLGLIRESQYLPMHTLSESDKANAQRMLQPACQDWDRVVPFDDETSFLQYLSQLSSSMNHSSCPVQEGTNNNNSVARSIMNDSYRGISSPLSPSRGAFVSSISPSMGANASSPNCCGSRSVSIMDISNFPIHSPDRPGFRHFLPDDVDDANFQFEESIFDLPFVPPHDGSICKVHVQNRRWKMLHSILRRGGAAALMDTHIHKKQKVF